MKKIAVITSLAEHCGITTYFRHLEQELNRDGDLKYSCLTDEVIVNQFRNGGSKYDAILINWHPARLSVSVPQVRMLQATGAKVILIWHNSMGHRIEVGQEDILAVCDAVVAHEPVDCNVPIRYIPHGIPNTVGTGVPMPPLKVGTAGFPFPWKRPDVVVAAAKHADCRASITAPPYPGWGWRDRDWAKDPRVDVTYDWLEEDALIAKLSENVCNIFWYQSQGPDDELGQSGSVRLGIAAGRPMVVSRHRKFRTLLEEYPDCFYVADTEDEVYNIAEYLVLRARMADVYLEPRCPSRVHAEQNWLRVGRQYRALIEELCGGQNG